MKAKMRIEGVHTKIDANGTLVDLVSHVGD